MQVSMDWDAELDNVLVWQFNGFIGVVHYLPLMNDSILRAMTDPDNRYDFILNMGVCMPLPNRAFRYVEQPIVGAPPNLKRVVIATANPLTRGLIAATLGRSPRLAERLRVVGSMPAARTFVSNDRV